MTSRGVSPYLDGYKVRLAIGNLTTATFRGAKVTVRWGPPLGVGKDIEALNAHKERTFDVTTVVTPGSDSIADVTHTPATADEVKEFRVGLGFKVVAFR